jgi:hypothetical protein
MFLRSDPAAAELHLNQQIAKYFRGSDLDSVVAKNLRRHCRASNFGGNYVFREGRCPLMDAYER